MIKSIGFDQKEIIQNILFLHCKTGIELDPTYSKGLFYKNSSYSEPKYKYDLFPIRENVKKSDACDLPFSNDSIFSIMFDPPFLAGYTKNSPTGIIGDRFYGFRYMKDLWEWYEKCLLEFYRILKNDGVLIFKCQDTVSSGKQWFSHVFIMNKALECGYLCVDIFVLLAKNRILGHNHKNQKHARKFHSYFLVFKKRWKK